MAEPRKRRTRTPLMAAFRAAYQNHDAKLRIDERDEAGERVIAGRRAGPRASLSEAELQRDVAQDLESLMNTVNFASGRDMGPFPLVDRSILNFGFPDVVHRSIDEIGVSDVGDEIETVLVHFEPRLLRESIEVRRDASLDPTELKVRFSVRAELRCDPLNLPVQFVADLERDTGKIVIRRA